MIVYSKVTQPNYHDPVWLSEAKIHLKVDGTDQDSLITQKIAVASSICERYSGLSFMKQTRSVTLDRFYCNTDVILPYGPVSSVTTFSYKDADGNDATIADDTYTLDLQSALAKVRVTESWPYTNSTLNNVVIEYEAGVDDPMDVYPEAREAIFKLVARMFEQRGDTGGELLTPEIYELLDLIKVYWSAG